jgi:hypothetical protein
MVKAKKALDYYILSEWKKNSSKLSKPLTPVSKKSFFSQSTAQLIFIFILFIVVTYPFDVIYFSQTIIGRTVAVIVLIYFTSVHPMVGVILSMAMILYYHSDLVKSYYYESVLNRTTLSTLRELKGNPITTRPQESLPKYIQSESFRNMEASKLSSAYPFTDEVKSTPWSRPYYFNYFQIHEGFDSMFESEVDKNSMNKNKDTAGYEPYIASYDLPSTTTLPYSIRQSEIIHDPLTAELEALDNARFRQEHCSATGDLMHKGEKIPASMAEFIFPQLQIQGSQDGHPCNPCSPSCPIRISKTDQRLDTERVLQQRNQPSLKKTSADWVPSWFDVFLPHPVFQTTNDSAVCPFPKPSNSL